MAASSEERWSGLKDADMYNKLIKLHLPTEPKQCSLYWSTSDMEVIVGHFTSFLCAIASTGHKIDKAVLTKELQKFFSSSQQECKDFATKLADALSYCRFCRKSLKNGSKTSAPVLRVINAMNIDKKDESVFGVRSSSSSSLATPATPPVMEKQPSEESCEDAEESLGDTAKALQAIERAFGTGSAVEDESAPGPVDQLVERVLGTGSAAEDESAPSLVDLRSPISVASSSVADSPAKMASASSRVPYVPELTAEVPSCSLCAGGQG